MHAGGNKRNLCRIRSDVYLICYFNCVLFPLFSDIRNENDQFSYRINSSLSDPLFAPRVATFPSLYSIPGGNYLFTLDLVSRFSVAMYRTNGIILVVFVECLKTARSKDDTYKKRSYGNVERNKEAIIHLKCTFILFSITLISP